MVSIIIVLAGFVGGLISIAALIGIAIAEPSGFIIAALIVYGIWKLVLRSERKGNLSKLLVGHPSIESLENPVERF